MCRHQRVDAGDFFLCIRRLSVRTLRLGYLKTDLDRMGSELRLGNHLAALVGLRSQTKDALISSRTRALTFAVVTSISDATRYGA